MVRHKIVRTLVVATSLVAMVIGSIPRAFLFADEFPPSSSIGSAASPQWELTTLTVYDSNDASISVTVDSAGTPVITASVDQDASSGTFAFSMVSDDGFESMLVSGEVLADGSVSYQTVNANLAGAGGAAATGGGGATVVTGVGMSQNAIANAFFHGQTLAQNPQVIAALLWYLQVARDTLVRYQQMGYTGPGVATQTARIQQIIAQLQAWGVPIP